MTLTPAQIRNIEWTAERAYRVLGHYFVVRWNDWKAGDLGAVIDHVLGAFEVTPDPRETRNPPTPGMPPTYSLVALPRSRRGRYRLLYRDGSLLRSDNPGEVFTHFLWHVNWESIHVTGNFVLVHSGAVVADGDRAMLLPGNSGSGKSTLTTALVRSGFGYLSDEAAAIDPVSGRIFAFPKAVTLKDRFLLDKFPDVQPRIQDEILMNGKWHLTAEDIRKGSLVASAGAAVIVFPSYVPGARLTVTPMRHADATAELTKHTMNLGMYGGRALPLLARVVQNTKCYRLLSGDLDCSLETLHQLAQT